MLDISDFLERNGKVLFLVLILIFASFQSLGYVLSYRDIAFNIGGSAEDFILHYTAGENLALKGFSQLIFLPDYSTEFSQNAQPIFYTHYPSLTAISSGIMIKVGLNVLQQRMIFAIISLLGVFFLYLFVSRVASVTAAVFSSILLIINYGAYINWLDQGDFALGYPLFFSYLWLRSSQSKNKYFVIPLIFLISSFLNYAFLAFMVILELLFYIFEKDKKLFLGSLLAAMTGIVVHIVQNMIALTPLVAWQDIWLTIQNRLYGIPTRADLFSFYQAHNLVLWGVNPPVPLRQYLWSIVAPFYLFKASLITGALALFIFGISRQSNIYKNRKILVILLLGTLLWLGLIRQTIGSYALAVNAFIIIFIGLVLSDLFSFLRQTFLEELSVKKVLNIVTVLLIMSFVLFKYQVRAGGINNDRNMSNLFDTLENYKGKTFFTNMLATTVSYKTQNWTVGSCSSSGLKNLDASQCYSKFVALEDDKLMPDYVLVSDNFSNLDCLSDCRLKLRGDLVSRYKLVEEINEGGETIFQVKSK